MSGILLAVVAGLAVGWFSSGAQNAKLIPKPSETPTLAVPSYVFTTTPASSPQASKLTPAENVDALSKNSQIEKALAGYDNTFSCLR